MLFDSRDRRSRSVSDAAHGNPRRRLGRAGVCMEDLESRRLLSMFTFFGYPWTNFSRTARVTPVKAQASVKTTTPLAAASVPQVVSTPATQTGGMTVLAQENFASNVSASSPDAFDTVTGTLYSDVGGPTTPATAGTAGVSADPQEQGSSPYSPVNNPITATWNLKTGGEASAAQDGGFMGGWFFFKFTDFDPYAPDATGLMSVSGDANLYLNVNEQLEFSPGHSIATMPLNQWIFIGTAWTYNTSTTTFSYEVYTKLPGGALTSIYTSTPQHENAAPSTASLLDGPSVTGGNDAWEGRVGGFFIGSINSFGDVAMPSSVLDPVLQKLWFGVDPVNGNDSNSGIVIPIFAANGTTVIGFAPGSAPWKTLERVNTALTYSGLFSQNVAWVNASNDSPADETQSATALQAEIAAGTVIRNPLISELVIDTASGPFNISDSGGIDATGGIQLDTNVNLTGFGSDVGDYTNVADLEAFIDIPKDSWTLAPGSTDTYETTDTSLNAVLWQDRRWMNLIEGTSFSQVEAQLESTPGSFWTDGTTLYVHPFGNTDPATDSSVYERSPGGTYSNSIGVLVQVPNCYISGLAIGGTCGAVDNTGDPIGLYCVGSGLNTGGLNYFDDLYLYYASKHAFGWTDGGSNERVIVTNVEGEQGSPYTAFGGQYLFVDYDGNAAATGNQVLYLNCRAKDSDGLIGSTAGQQLTIGTFYIHGVVGEFSIVSVIDCNFDGNIGCDASVTNLVVTDTACAEIDSSAANLVADRDTTDTNLIRGSGTVTNCIMKSPIIYGIGSGSHLISGTTSYIDCVFDGRGATVDNEPSYFYPNGTASLTIRDCIFLANSTFPVIDDFQSGDQIDFDHNLYDTSAGKVIATNFSINGGKSNYSFAQWQSIGYDAGSMDVADSALNINLTTYVPFAQTPITFDVGLLDDMTGDVFLDRKTIGAYEYVPPIPIYAPPPGSGLSTGDSYTPPAGTGLN
ncbi:MAG TPA: hypothetical protein VHX86_16455 [Tepidisphaeraceae bacterium]|jgi:hypothetical protein|nr:hypothetical protein [Tepidisphaeraceae bacterium]